jgi:hypothetical protein
MMCEPEAKMVCEPEALDPQALDPQGTGARSTRLQLASARHARVEGEASRHEGEAGMRGMRGMRGIKTAFKNHR